MLISLLHTALLATCCCAAAQTPAPGGGAGEWEQVLSEAGVRGYARQRAGTDLLEFRSTAVIPASIDVVGVVLRDVEGLKRSSKSCLEARILSQKDRNDYTFYVAYGMPIPFTNRDVVIHATTTYDVMKGRAICELRALPVSQAPPRDGFVRITDLRAQFIIEYLGPAQTGIVYTSRVDPGGHIPDFLINYTSKHSIYSSVIDLRRASQDPKHSQAAQISPDHELVAQITHDPAQMKTIVQNRLGEYIPERELTRLLAEDPGVFQALVNGEGSIGEILLHGWGSRESQRMAVSALLRRLLATRIQDPARLQKMVEDPLLLDRILAGRGGAAAVRALLQREPK